jgi:hypothetical protein
LRSAQRWLSPKESGARALAPVLVGQVAEPGVAQVLAQAQPAEGAGRNNWNSWHDR